MTPELANTGNSLHSYAGFRRDSWERISFQTWLCWLTSLIANPPSKRDPDMENKIHYRETARNETTADETDKPYFSVIDVLEKALRFLHCLSYSLMFLIVNYLNVVRWQHKHYEVCVNVLILIATLGVFCINAEYIPIVSTHFCKLCYFYGFIRGNDIINQTDLAKPNTIFS